jgi:hypothetical protein
MFPYTILAETESTRRMTRRTHTVMKVADTDGFTVRERCLWSGIRAVAMAAAQINTVISGQNTRMQRI